METKDERRRRKLQLLVAGVTGGLETISVRSETSPQYLQQIIKGVLLPPKKDGTRSPRSLGDAAAEAIEDAFDLGRGWFDSDRPLPTVEPPKIAERAPRPYPSKDWPFTEFTQEEYALLDTQQKGLVESMIVQFIKTREPPAKHQPPANNTTKAGAA
ncbi:MAG TPA: hypothetical protein DHV21_14495 [Curvibacter sp.]|nr:hypothetical protein [Curvibacter sp.]